MSNYDEEYKDIINLPRHISTKHPKMSLELRSAQFAPFSALVGYDEQIKETSKIIKKRKEINDELKAILDEKLQIIQKKIETKPQITVTYFVPELNKDGGNYIEYTGKVKKIDNLKQKIIFEDGTEILVDDIIEIVVDI